MTASLSTHLLRCVLPLRCAVVVTPTFLVHAVSSTATAAHATTHAAAHPDVTVLLLVAAALPPLQQTARHHRQTQGHLGSAAVTAAGRCQPTKMARIG
jgi:hypothetical protein